jgi:hypothetical protein
MPTSKAAGADGEAWTTARFSHIYTRLQEALDRYDWDPEIEPFHSVSSQYILLHVSG